MSTATIAQIADVVARAATDSSWRQQLLASPAATLSSAGISIPSGMSVQVLENSSSIAHVVLPSRPSGVSDDDLKPIAAAPAVGTSIADKLDAFGRLVVATWTDNSLKSQFLQNPASVMSARGIALPSGVTVKAVAESASTLYVVIPAATGGQS